MDAKPRKSRSKNTDNQGIMVFRPTYKEFENFPKYIEFIESKGAHNAGLAKVIPPPEWVPRKSGYELDNILFNIDKPLVQLFKGKQGLYKQGVETSEGMTVKYYCEMANSPRYRTPEHIDYDDIEDKYWKQINSDPPIYGTDVSGSLTDPDVHVWNMNKLDSILNLITEDNGVDEGIYFEGVNTPYLYFGMWRTTFAWHTEDMDLYSINYLHFGAPKTWYAIPPKHGRRFEQVASSLFPRSSKKCQAFLRHKEHLISPKVLKKHSVPFDRVRFYYSTNNKFGVRGRKYFFYKYFLLFFLADYARRGRDNDNFSLRLSRWLQPWVQLRGVDKFRLGAVDRVWKKS